MSRFDLQPKFSDPAARTLLWVRPPAVAAAPCGPGLIDDRYRTVALMKRGGMAEVYAAEHVVTRRRVAIKRLRSCWSRDSDMCRRFHREAQVLARIDHPNVVEVVDFGVDHDGFGYLVMELLYGEDLQATLRREGRLSLVRTTEILLQICGALGAAHTAGVHRDLKPVNCFRVGFRKVDDFIKLVDFGLGRRLGPCDHDNDPISRVGSVLGTVYYMAPEQAAGGAVDHRVDVYAAGVLLYQLVTGKLPFRGNGLEETMRQIHSADIPAIRDVAPDLDVPAALEAILHTAIAFGVVAALR